MHLIQAELRQFNYKIYLRLQNQQQFLHIREPKAEEHMLEMIILTEMTKIGYVTLYMTTFQKKFLKAITIAN
mgnify:CR=1 FL=1